MFAVQTPNADTGTRTLALHMRSSSQTRIMPVDRHDFPPHQCMKPGNGRRKPHLGGRLDCLRCTRRQRDVCFVRWREEFCVGDLLALGYYSGVMRWRCAMGRKAGRCCLHDFSVSCMLSLRMGYLCLWIDESWLAEMRRRAGYCNDQC